MTKTEYTEMISKDLDSLGSLCSKIIREVDSSRTYTEHDCRNTDLDDALKTICQQIQSSKELAASLFSRVTISLHRDGDNWCIDQKIYEDEDVDWESTLKREWEIRRKVCHYLCCTIPVSTLPEYLKNIEESSEAKIDRTLEDSIKIQVSVDLNSTDKQIMDYLRRIFQANERRDEGDWEKVSQAWYL